VTGIRHNQLNIDWRASVTTFTDLSGVKNAKDGDVVFVRDIDTLYVWDAPTGSWVIPAAYPKGLTNGCRLEYI